MLTIYGVYRSRASRNIWLANELGLPFKLRAGDPALPPARRRPPADASLHTRSPEFLKVNPNGHVPTIDDDGLVLHESLAINLYLAKKHGGPLAPANVAEDGEMSMWSLWAATEVEPHALNVIYHRIGNPPGRRIPRSPMPPSRRCAAPFAVLDAALAKDGYLVGGRFTVADINVAEIVRYAQARAGAVRGGAAG